MRAFADRLLDWWMHSGRHDLPWQIDRTPYRVWVSEIMLQQTQVSTVIEYFNRFMMTFPSLEALARAEQDDVLALWSGLGYYARARNLLKAAKQCMDRHGGQLPSDPQTLCQLPGIGRSTAHAIVAQSHDVRAVILDGNVKRVLARHSCIEGWPGQAKVEKKLWDKADQLTPDHSAANYTQAIMDLGATVCTRHHPNCRACPVADDCQALASGRVGELPSKKPKKASQTIQLTLMIVFNSHGQVLLHRRPSHGIWGGLWCLPTHDLMEWPQMTQSGPAVAPMRHLLTHRILILSFQSLTLSTNVPLDSPNTACRWFELSQTQQLGLPKPIERVLQNLSTLGY